MNKTIKICALGVLFLAGMHAAYAQPTTAAPTPKQPADDVVSLFSDHYETTGKGPEPQSYGGDNAVTKDSITINGITDYLLRSSGNSNGVFTSNWSAQKKGTIHLDVYAETSGTFSFGIGTTFSASSQTWLDDYEWPTLEAGTWTSIEVPVVEFVKKGLDDATNVQSIRFKGKGKYYIDNIYAYGEKQEYVAPVDIPIAPTPQHDETENLVKSAFSDSYKRSTKEDPFTVSYAGKISTIKRSYVSDENQFVLEMKNLSTAGVNVSTWDLTKCNFVHIDVYWDGSGDGTFEFGMNKDDWSGKNFSYMENFTWPQLVANEWTSIDIPLAEFASFFQLKIIMLQFKGSGTFYVDNLYGYYEEQEPVVIEVPTTVPTIEGIDKANVMSIFCEQFEEEGYQDSDLGMTDTDATGNLMNYGQNADQTREFVEIVPGNQTIHLMNWNDYPFKIHKNSTTMDLSGMDYLHASAYLMSPLDMTNKPLTVTFWMHEKEGDQLNPTEAAVTLIPGQWVSFSVPLCHYSEKLDLTKTYVLRFREGGYPAMEVYLDNIFAYKGEPVGTLAPDCEEVEECIPIQNSEDGTLPPEKQPMLGVNLSSASGGTVPGILGNNYAMPKMQDLYYFHAKGVKLFRFPFRWKRIQDELGGPLVEEDIEAMKKVVAEAERLGMWVMLDMHDYAEYSINSDTTFAIDGRYQTYKDPNNPDLGKGNWKVADEPHERDLRVYFADVWQKLASEFKEYSNIWGYDLMNEPKGVDIDGLREGYQMAIDAIREVDQRTAIVVEGKNYSGADGWPSNAKGLENLVDPIGNNIVYEAHCYFDSDNSGTYQDSYDVEVGDNFDVYKKRLDPFTNWLKEYGKRGMLGEYGVPYNGAKQSDPRYMVLIDSVFSYLKQHQLTSTIWCAGFFYEDNHLSVSPGKDYCTEKSTMGIMEKYITNFHEGWVDDESGIGHMIVDNNLSIYPNPVENMVMIQGNRPIKTVKVYNLFGQVVLEQTLNAVQGELDLSELAAGNYMLQAEMPNGEISMTHVIKK